MGKLSSHVDVLEASLSRNGDVDPMSNCPDEVNKTLLLNADKESVKDISVNTIDSVYPPRYFMDKG